MGTQLGYTFQARINSTSPATATMLFIDRTSSAAGGGVFQDIVLRKTASGFEFVAPNSVSGTAPSGWSVASAVDLVLNDINLDGFVDVLVRGLGSAITGAVDQIVYAPGRTGGSPTILTAVDSSLTNFLSEVSSWTQNPMFFQQHQETVVATITIYRENCFIDERKRYCRSYPILVLERSGVRYTNKSPEAREFAARFPVVNGRIDPVITPGSQQAMKLSRILSTVLGTEVFDGELERGCAPTESCQTRSNHYSEAIMVTVEEFWDQLDRQSDTADADGDGVTDPGEFRYLTAGEKTTIRQFGYFGELDLDMVKIYHQPKYHTRPDRGSETSSPHDWFAIGNNVIGVSQCDEVTGNVNGCFMEEFTMTKELASLMHELTHVWLRSNRNRILIYPPRDSTVYTSGPYDYRMENGMIEDKDWLCFAEEQKAEMIGDLYREQNSQPAREAYNRRGGDSELVGDLSEVIGDPPLTAAKPNC